MRDAPAQMTAMRARVGDPAGDAVDEGVGALRRHDLAGGEGTGGGRRRRGDDPTISVARPSRSRTAMSPLIPDPIPTGT